MTGRMIFLLIVAMLMGDVGFFMVGYSIGTKDSKAIAVSRTWEGIAMQWKSNSDRFEAVALEFQRQAMQKADDFAVCNSMLPVEKRM